MGNILSCNMLYNEVESINRWLIQSNGFLCNPECQDESLPSPDLRSLSA